jgi:two-component system, NarL family, sensor histidine kinase UhpB
MQDITERKEAAEEITKSHERYEFVNKATQDTIWEWDYHTNKGKWGEGIITTFGYSEDKLNYGESWVDEYVHPEDKERLFKKIQGCIENSLQNCQNEYRFRCADGTYKYVFDRGFILYDEKDKPYRMIGAMTDVTEKKRLERELVEQQIKQQKLITETIIQTQEKERNELGRELHDNINQILATVKMYLGMAKAKENVSVDLVGQSYEYVNEAMEEIRKLSHSLVAPSIGDIGLKEVLQGLVEDANLLNDLQVQLLFDEKYNEMDIDKNKELMFYRIVQEQMNNIAKYAKANKVVISFKTDDDILILSVADDGVGFDSSQKSKGIGLKNISSRVEFYSGNMNIISAPGLGCTLEVFIPC